MRKILFIMFLGVFFSSVSAQDIIVLKDSKRIDAKIEEVSEGTVKYKKLNNLEGPSFIINKSQISTIIYANGEAEVVSVALKQMSDSVVNDENDDDDDEDNEEKNHGVKRGFRGFYSIGGTVGVGDNAIGRFEESVSIGGQVCPYFFVGGGLNYSLWLSGIDISYSLHGLTPFLHLRSDVLDNPITPFVDMRIGYTFIDVEGVYFSPSTGCRFGGRRTNLAGSISVGYTLQMADVVTGYRSYSYYYYDINKRNCGGITIRGTFEF